MPSKTQTHSLSGGQQSDFRSSITIIHQPQENQQFPIMQVLWGPRIERLEASTDCLLLMGAFSLVHILLAVNVSLVVLLRLLNVRSITWTSRNDNIPVLAVELLAPEEAGAVVSGAFVNDGVGILGDSLNFDRDFLRVLSGY